MQIFVYDDGDESGDCDVRRVISLLRGFNGYVVDAPKGMILVLADSQENARKRVQTELDLAAVQKIHNS
jgi:hypothetical protein